MSSKSAFTSLFLLFGLIISPLLPIYAQNNTLKNTSLIEWIHTVEKNEGYRFLYRESLIKDTKVHWDPYQSIAFQINKVFPQLTDQNLEASVNYNAKQIVIYPLKANKPLFLQTFSGLVVDNQSGERLPFATVQWEINDRSRGLSTNLSGQFVLTNIDVKDTLTLKLSYIGYKTLTVTFTKSELRSDVIYPFRLDPQVQASKEVVVEGLGYFTDQEAADSSIELMNGQILGEENTIGALQILPSVQMTSAINNGLNIRGAASDGLSIFLDGIQVYNQSHFFGLFDTFNASAIQYSALHYDVIPASVEASSGGVLSLKTKNGSLNEQKYAAGLSSSSAQFTIESPIKRAQNSFLLSFKHSLLNQFAPVATTNLIHWGLDVNRKKVAVNPTLQFSTENESLVSLSDARARFGDLHFGLFHEAKSGLRLAFKSYYGFDDMQSDYQKLIEQFDVNSPNGRRLVRQTSSTENQWNNAKSSLHLDYQVGKNAHIYQDLGFSLFKSDFYKDDFGFYSINSVSGNVERREFPLQIQSIINDVTFNQRLEWVRSNTWFNLGFDYHFLMAEYFEDSINKASLYVQQEAHKFDTYASAIAQLTSYIEIESGLRVSYFNADQSLRWSPRFKANIKLSEALSFASGYSFHNQFKSRVRFSNVLSSDVWILADQDQPPVEVATLSAGLYYQPNKQWTLQVEVYNKQMNHLRLHELDWYAIPDSFVRIPWFSENSGEAQGIEFLVYTDLGPIQFTQTYTWSSSTIQNDLLNNGKAFYADWDRRHQAVSLLKWSLSSTVDIRLTQTIASGNPNRLFLLGQDAKKRLDAFYRTDIQIGWVKPFSASVLKAHISLYNVLNRKNSWYRELGLLMASQSQQNQFVEGPIEVYDLGFQPSISLNFSF